MAIYILLSKITHCEYKCLFLGFICAFDNQRWFY